MSSVPALGSLVARKYRVRELIGAGAMGRVYRAQNELTGKWVALKWVQPDAMEGQYASARLLREARAASKLKHPNVIDVYDVVQDGRNLWLVMELLQGMTLSAYLRHHRPPTCHTLLPMNFGLSCKRTASASTSSTLGDRRKAPSP